MDDPLSPARLAADAVYLAILTLRGLKPLSRLEYAVDAACLDWLAEVRLLVVAVMRPTRNGVPVRHLVMSRDAGTLRRYCDEFDGQPLCGETPAVVRREAHYFGYPACCAEAYIRAPHAPNGLVPDDQALLFHRACPGCRVTPTLIPGYRAALAEAEAVCRRLAALRAAPSRLPESIPASVTL
jgi:hypothetical protein